MNRGVSTVTIMLLTLLATQLGAAVEFNGTVYNVTGSPLNDTTINVTIRSMNDFSILGYNSTTTNASGWFNLSMPTNDTWMYEPSMTHSTNAVVDYVGQSLPAFPYQVISQVSGTSFFLLEAGTINITAVNQTGSAITFNYQIKDQKLGYPVAGNMEQMDSTSVSEAVVYLPKNRNYSIMLFPNQSMPATFNWNNFSATSSYNFDGGLSSYNATTAQLDKRFNMTMGHGRVWGYAQIDSVNGLDAFKIVPYMLEPGSMVHVNFGTMPTNLSAFFDGTSDWYNLSSGIENNSGFYNISLPSTVEFSEMLLFAAARNGSTYYGGFHNLSLDYGTYTNGQNLNLNFTNMFGLLGTETNVSMQDPMGGADTNVTTLMQSFNLFNESNVTLTDIFAHIEATVDYTAYSVKKFTWMSDIEQGTSTTFKIPLLNTTGVEEINVFAEGGNYAPTRNDYTVTELLTNPNITLKSFSPEDLSGNVGAGSSSITIELYTSNSTCDVPNPPVFCDVGSSEGMDTFNPLRAIMGGGKLSFRMGTGGVLVHYVNVDMLASGPPDALFEDNSGVSETTSGSFGKAMRFGSGGPTIYDYILISMPYTEGSSSTTGLNETETINLSLPTFYDEDWNVIWNASTNGTNGTQLGANHSHYETHATDWETLMGGVSCITNVSNFNATNPCYVNTTSNRIWVRLPHFSGTGPAISGSVVTAETTNTNSNSNPGSSGTSTTRFSASTVALQTGYDIRLQRGHIIDMKIKGEAHQLKILQLNSSVATIEIKSDPITIMMKENETKQIDINADGEKDLQIHLKEIIYPRARLIITELKQTNKEDNTEKNAGTKEDETSTNEEGTKTNSSTGKGSSMVVWILLILAIICITAYFIQRNKRKKKA